MQLPKTIETLSRSCQKCSYLGCHGSNHYSFQLWLYYRNIKNRFRTFIYNLGALDYSQIEDVEVDGIDTRDYPDFCDAYIASATYKGRAMTEKELERLNNDGDFVYSAVQKHLY